MNGFLTAICVVVACFLKVERGGLSRAPPLTCMIVEKDLFDSSQHLCVFSPAL